MSAMPAGALGRPIKGPSALGGDVRRMMHLTVTLAVMEFKLRFFGSVLGYLWQLMRPLMLFGVMYVVFTEFLRFGQGVPHYQVVLLTGIVLFTFFADATGASVTSVADRESMVRKIEFPRLVVPMAVLLTAYFNLALNMIAVLVFVLAAGVEPRPEWLLYPFVLLVLGLLAMGLAMLLSALYVRFRDVKPIWEVLLQVVFYGSPILYVLEGLPNPHLARAIAVLNPLAPILVESRHILIDPTAPTAAGAAGGVVRLLVPAAMVVGVLVIGFWVFNREAPRIAEEL